VSLYQSLQPSRRGFFGSFVVLSFLRLVLILIVVLIYLACRNVFDLIVRRGNTTIL
jgi:hypothetical protein